jgi:hypothetical protein
MYEVMFSALEDTKAQSKAKDNSNALIEEYQNKVYDLE